MELSGKHTPVSQRNTWAFTPAEQKPHSAVCVFASLNLVWSLVRQIGYREKAREEASRGGSLVNRPDIALATHVSQLTSQVHRTFESLGAHFCLCLSQGYFLIYLLDHLNPSVVAMAHTKFYLLKVSPSDHLLQSNY